ncbi:MAG: CDP-alcohol phosphatidyltransferase family protein [Ginsengibacter sp.]
MIESEIVKAQETKRIFKDRKRTNLLRRPEQWLISFFVKRTPLAITSNILTGIGFGGSLLVLLGFILAEYGSRYYLLLCILGLFINWFGDSLDGRIAYYRNIPRKWYGFSLDIIMDWIGTVLIGLGYLFYAKNDYELAAFILVVLYGWAMIISQLRYKITDEYTIDAGLFGPTEIRILLSIIILGEIIFPDTMQYFVATICVALFFINIMDTRKLLRLGNARDKKERRERRLKAKSFKEE